MSAESTAETSNQSASLPANRAITAVWPGQPYPRGATWDGEGVNFAVFSANATKVELCIFESNGRREVQRIELRERTDEAWHAYLPEARPGLYTAIACMAPTTPNTAIASIPTSC